MASYTSRLFVRLHRMSKKMVADGLGEQRVYIEGKDRHGILEIYKTLRKFTNRGDSMTWKELKVLLDRKLDSDKFTF